MTDASDTPEMEVSGTPEKADRSPYTPVRFHLPEDASPELQLTARVANKLLEGFDAAYQLCKPYVDHPISLEGLKTSTTGEAASAERNSFNLDAYRKGIFSLMQSLHGLEVAALKKDVTYDVRAGCVEIMIKGVDSTIQGALRGRPFQLLTDPEISEDEALLKQVVDRFDGILHDFGNDATNLVNIQILLTHVTQNTQ